MKTTKAEKESIKWALVSVARGEVGVKEDGGNNLGKRVDEYRTASDYSGPPAEPWCAEFCCWVLLRALTICKIPGRTAGRCRSALAYGWEAWARQAGLDVLDSTTLAKAGDFVIFNFSHIGIVERDQEPYEHSIRTIEGNTGEAGAQRDGTRDGVNRRERASSLVRCYLRF